MPLRSQGPKPPPPDTRTRPPLAHAELLPAQRPLCQSKRAAWVKTKKPQAPKQQDRAIVPRCFLAPAVPHQVVFYHQHWRGSMAVHLQGYRPQS